jgi:hypothetical protein
MPFSMMLRHVALVRTDVSEDRITSFPRIVFWLLITANIVPPLPIPITLMMEAIRSSDTSVHTKATRRNISQDDILHSQSVLWLFSSGCHGNHLFPTSHSNVRTSASQQASAGSTRIYRNSWLTLLTNFSHALAGNFC